MTCNNCGEELGNNYVSARWAGSTYWFCSVECSHEYYEDNDFDNYQAWKD